MQFFIFLIYALPRPYIFVVLNNCFCMAQKVDHRKFLSASNDYFNAGVRCRILNSRVFLRRSAFSGLQSYSPFEPESLFGNDVNGWSCAVASYPQRYGSWPLTICRCGLGNHERGVSSWSSKVLSMSHPQVSIWNAFLSRWFLGFGFLERQDR